MRLALSLLLVGCGTGSATVAVRAAAPSAEPAIEPETAIVAEPDPGSEPDRGAPETVAEPEPAPTFAISELPPGASPVAGAVDTLGPWAWPVEPEADASVHPAGPYLVAIGESLVAYAADGTTPTRSRPSPIGAPTAFSEGTSARPLVASGLLFFRGAGDAIGALDPATLEVRWTGRITAGRGRGEEHLATRDTFVVVTSSSMYGLDAATGRHLYARPLEEHERGPSMQAWRTTADAILSVGPNGYHVIARDPRTGDERWRAEIGETRLYEGDDDHLIAIVDHETAVVLAAADGREIARIALGTTAWHGRTASLDGGELHVLLHESSTSLRVAAYDVASGRRIWRSEPFELRADDHAQVLADRDAVYVCTDSRLSALDRADGALRWWAHPGSCAGLRAYRPAPGEPAIVLSAYGDLAYARTGVARTPRRLRVSGRVTVEGRPRARVTVRVGSVHAETDGRGRYRATIEAWDDVPVEVDCDGCVPGSATILASDPDTSPTVDLALEAIHGDDFDTMYDIGW